MLNLDKQKVLQKISIMLAELDQLAAPEGEVPTEVLAEMREVRRSRPVNQWIIDVLYLMQYSTQYLTRFSTTKEGPSRILEDMLFKLISFYPNLYEYSGPMEDCFDRGKVSKTYLDVRKDGFVSICHALVQLEQQQEAKEREKRGVHGGTRIPEGRKSGFEEAYWLRPLEQDTSFFLTISKSTVEFKASIATFYGNIPNDWTETAWNNWIKNIFQRIGYYPITAMLMPALLTKAIVDGPDLGLESIYALMKYRKSSFPRGKKTEYIKEEVQELYDVIVEETDKLNSKWINESGRLWRDATKKQGKTTEENSPGELAADKLDDNFWKSLKEAEKKYKIVPFHRQLPVAFLSEIVDVLCDKFAQSNYPNDRKELLKKLNNYTGKNGPSFTESKKGFSANDRILLSVAKLCNANSYLNFMLGDLSNKEISAALDLLAEEKIIADNECSVPLRYIKLYREFCQTFNIYGEDLSTLALCKYCELHSWSFLRRIRFFDELYSRMEETLLIVKSEILSKADEESVFLEFYGYGKFSGLFDKLNREFLAQDSKYGMSGIEKFLSDPNHLTYNGFQQFLDSKAGFWGSEKILAQHKRGITYKLFDYTVDMVSSFLMEELRQYCIQQMRWYADK